MAPPLTNENWYCSSIGAGIISYSISNNEAEVEIIDTTNFTYSPQASIRPIQTPTI